MNQSMTVNLMNIYESSTHTHYIRIPTTQYNRNYLSPQSS